MPDTITFYTTRQGNFRPTAQRLVPLNPWHAAGQTSLSTHEKKAPEQRQPSSYRASIQPPADTSHSSAYNRPGRRPWNWQMLRFALVGAANTLVDLACLNGLLWLLPTTNTAMLLVYNALAYSVGAINSFFLNKYWTFGNTQQTTRGELLRFALTTLCGIGWSSGILWLVGRILHHFFLNTTLWANASKVFAIAGTMFISYLGMRLWVFVRHTQKEAYHHV